MMGDNDDMTNVKTKRTGTTLTEGDLAFGVLKDREAKYSCCFQTNLYFTAIIAGLLQGYQIGIIAGTELFIGD